MAFSKAQLEFIRNDVPVDSVIDDICVATGRRKARRTFQCPECRGFHTATNPRANLARCFRCRRNYNPIDLVIAARGSTFLEAVQYLTRFAAKDPFNEANRHCNLREDFHTGSVK